MTAVTHSVAFAQIGDFLAQMSSVPSLLILIGAIIASAFIVSMLGRVIHHMDQDHMEDLVPRANRDRRSGNLFSPPYMSSSGLVQFDRRSGIDRRTMAH